MIGRLWVENQHGTKIPVRLWRHTAEKDILIKAYKSSFKCSDFRMLDLAKRRGWFSHWVRNMNDIIRRCS